MSRRDAWYRSGENAPSVEFIKEENEIIIKAGINYTKRVKDTNIE